MIALEFERRVQAPPERVFEVLADLASYKEWLPPSDVFVGLKPRDDGPLRQGSRYLDITKAGATPGEVTVHDPPHRITFVEGVSKPLMRFSVEIAYRLEPVDGGTRVVRTVRMTSSFPVTLVEPFLAPRMKKESNRILEALARRVHAWPRDVG